MAKDYEELSATEQELIEAQKTPDPDARVVAGEDENAVEAEAEPEEKPKTPPRDETGKFTKAETDAREAPEPEPEETDTESEARPAEQPSPEEGDKRFVKLDALHAERLRRKDTETQLQELQQQFQQLTQALQQQKPPEQARQEQPDEPPDPVLDKPAFDAWLRNKIESVSQPYTQFQQAMTQTQQVSRAVEDLRNYATTHEQAFRTQHADKDYDGALGFAREKVAANLKLFGFNDGQIPQMVAQEEMKLTALAKQQNINPAALVYNWAIQNGYTPEQAKAQQSEADRVEKLGEAQRQTKSGAAATGSARSDDYTVEDLASMSEAKLAKVTRENPDLVRKLMGG